MPIISVTDWHHEIKTRCIPKGAIALCTDSLQCVSSRHLVCLQAWKYQPWVQEAIEKRLSKLADVHSPTIGFHVRGGDKLAEDKMLVSHRSQLSPLLHSLHVNMMFSPGKGTFWQRRGMVCRQA